MKTKLTQIIALCGTMAFVVTAQATLQDYESFNYSGTALAGQNGNTGWSTQCGLTGPWFTVGATPDNTLSDDGQSLLYPVPFEAPLPTPPGSGSRVRTGGASVNTATYRMLAHPIDLSRDGVVRYASALFRKNRPNGGGVNNDNVLLEFFDAPGNRRWGFGINGNGDLPWVNCNGSGYGTTPVTAGQTYLLVTKIVSSATGPDTAYLKVYGAGYGTQFPATEPTTWDAQASYATGSVLDRVKVRIDPGNTTDAPGEVDDIRIGDSWQDVVSVLQPPPPDTAAPVVLTVDSLVTNVLNVIFSEPVEQASAQDPANYTVTNGAITAITLLACTNVQITVDSILTTNYTVGVQNIRDVVGNAMVSTNVAGFAHGWEASQSVALPLSMGMAFAMNDKIVMLADGENISGIADHFQYLYNAVSGDFDLAVHVESLFRANNNSRAGLMARPGPDMAFDSPYVLIEATPDRFIFQCRTNSMEDTYATPAANRPPTVFPDCWIRLVRNGTVFTGYSSTNYGVWNLVDSFDTSLGNVPYPSDLFVGLVASAGNASLVTRAQFSGFGNTVLLVPPTLTAALSGDQVEVSWGEASLGFALQATPSLFAPVTWTNVPGSSTTNRVFLPVNAGPLFFRAIYPAP